ncbi:hypothetical protein [Arachidicoccus terrestris]|uniref:hypothetical protein n=1 Tax=Arachidicoccus terrestris TaxID=2875539 RepID=UPI001CC5F22D|nr:hypothetical protein [Arachidicoccus terrestris]UAY56402.1 hypothetical protein K9M52_05155 [Arachidicoccus terrestris]
METGNSNCVNIQFSTGKQSFKFSFVFNNGRGSYATEAELALGLLPSMLHRQSIDMSGKLVDGLFLNALTDIQHIFHHWDKDYKIIKINNAKTIDPGHDPHAVPKKRVGMFFSGGVDSFYTLLKHKAEITDIIFVHGMDIPLNKTRLRSKTVEALKSVASAFHINLIEVESNIREQLDPYADWGLMLHGVAMTSVGLLLQDDFSKIYISSSREYSNLFPLASHPMLDHLWSTNRIRFIHDGAEATRIEKVRLVSTSTIALQHLRVCWKNTDGAYNCSKCEKCLRTMISLYSFDKLEQCPTFTEPLNAKRVAGMKLKGAKKRSFARENLASLQQMKNSSKLQHALQSALRRAITISLFKKFIKKSYH